MMPYVVKKPFPIPECNYVAPKGTMMIPTTWLALHDSEAYNEPNTYDPERWISGNAEEQGKNWVFATIFPMDDLLLSFKRRGDVPVPA